ncbi:MAG: hypothetical protein ACKPGB_01475, partial [Dolichospermum sp.]
MNVTEVLQFVDQLVFERTGKHLDDVQQAVIEGSYKGQTYNEIAESNHFNKSHVGEIGGELWKFLSEVLGEDIKKTNFRSTVERLQITSLPIIIENNIRFGPAAASWMKLPQQWTAQSAALALSRGYRHFRVVGEQGKGPS